MANGNATISANATLLQNLVDPQVVAAIFDRKLTNAVKFSPLAKVDTTLVGIPGSTITVPSWTYISKATVTPEGTPITINQLTQTTVQAQIKKLGNGIEISDEARLSGFGDAIGEAASQLALSVADALDDEIITVLGGAQSYSVATPGKVVADDIADALVKFGEDIDGEKVVVISPADYATIRKSTNWIPGTEIGAEIIIRGTVGMIHGCQVVVSNRVSAGKAFIVKPGAVAIYLKRDTMVESDRDIINKTVVLTVDKHYASQLLDPSKAIKLV